MKRSVIALFWMNFVFVFFPIISPSRDPMGLDAYFYGEISLYGQLLSSFATPLLVAMSLAFALLETRRRPIQGALLFPAAAVAALMSVSAAAAATSRFETVVMALFFLLFNLYLMLMRDAAEGGEEILRWFRHAFVIWMLAPLVVMAIDPSLFDLFFTLTLSDVSYHGLAVSRVGYGLWISAFILLLGRPHTRWGWFQMSVAVTTLLLSQSRAGIIGLVVASAYLLLQTRRWSEMWPRFALLALAAVVPLAAWTMFGREDTLTFVSDERGAILDAFAEFIERNWLFGFGGMYVTDISAIDKFDVPAHNFLIQTVANYGVLTLTAFLVYFVALFRCMSSARAKAMLIFLFIYSMNQPVQGTGNFFNPITLLFFLIAFAVEIRDIRQARLASAAPDQGPTAVRLWMRRPRASRA